MSLLDRAIAREYLVNTVTLFVLLLCFVVAIDVSLNIDRFVKIADAMADREGEDASILRRGLVTVFLIADFWWPKLLQLYNYLLGIVLVGAMGFTCAQLVRRRELVAMVAAGQPLHRVARPILAVALAFTALAAVNQELLLPRVAPLVTRDHGEAGGRTLGETRSPLMSDAVGRLWYARSFDADRGVLEGVTIWERPASAEGDPGRRVRAASARWRDGGWDLAEGVAETRTRNPDRAGGSARADVERTPVARIETDLDPTTLRMRQFAGYAQALSFTQLTAMIDALDRLRADPERAARERDRLERYRLGRFSVMASNILALLIAMPFFVTRLPKNMVLQSLKCAPVAILALMGGVVGASASIPGVPAALGVFLPVMLLAPVAIAAATSVRT